MQDPRHRPGHTNYDWINGMRVGIVVGAVLGILIGVLVGWAPFALLLVGGASGGVLGANLAHRW